MEENTVNVLTHICDKLFLFKNVPNIVYFHYQTMICIYFNI